MVLNSESNASPSFLEIFCSRVTVELAKAESKPRGQQKRPTKEALGNRNWLV
jgi:hypothetical protein